MVRKIITTITAPVRGLHQAAYLLAALTLASQVLALVRDRIFAHQFGAGETLDLYYAAFKVPDLVFALVASLVSAYVLIPKLAESTKKESQTLLNQTATFLVVAGGALCAVLAFAAPALLAFLFPGLSGSAQAEEFVLLTRILLLQPILLGLSGVVTSVTQLKRKFTLYALSPVLYNIGIIAGVLFLYPTYGLSGIGWGVVAGALLHLAIHVPVLAEAKLVPRPTVLLPRVLWSVIKDSAPRSLALVMGSITALFLTALLAKSGQGSVAVYSFAQNLELVPLSLIGASYATAAFPVLAEQIGAKKHEEFKATLLAAARHLMFWSSAAIVLIIVLRAHVVRIVLGSGAFDWEATRLTAAVLAVLAVALIAQGFVLLASRAFYAAQRSWNPLLIQAGGLVVSVGAAWTMLVLAHAEPTFRYFFEALLRVDDIANTDVLFVALGASLGQIAMGFFAFATLRVVAPGVGSSLVRPLFEGLGAAILGGAAAYGVLAFMGNVATLTTLPSVLAQGAVAGMVGLVVTAGVLVLLENKEFRDLYASLRKITSTRALSPHGPITDRADT